MGRKQDRVRRLERAKTDHAKRVFLELLIVALVEVIATMYFEEHLHTAVTTTTIGVQVIRALLTEGEVFLG